ncbi:MAG: peptide chain release factor N(5)-glutamine methyltransferase [Clostridiales bacterium]|nr:peptide chain release factor N(5)-glutamine methyltransferase [Clostridiales bacterium]
MSTYKELLLSAQEILNDNGIADAKLDAWYLLAHVFGMTRSDFFLRENQESPRDKALLYNDLINKRARHIPLQYITGTQEFMGLEFEVDENVLIPRQDTEILVEEILGICENKSVLDLCTGSGCIIISLAKLGNIKNGVGSDISKKALHIAKRNAKKLNVDLTFKESDLFEKIEGRFDIIVSNPPYIKSVDILSLMPEVGEHEPRLALDGGEDGLLIYQRIIKELKTYLNPGGHVFFEIGYDQGEALSRMLEDSGFTEIYVKKDYGGLDRVVHGSLVFED